jgi:hypothetical protein
VATATRSRASRFDVMREYGSGPAGGESLAGVAGPDREVITTSPQWAIAVVRLGRTLSFSRRTNKSMGKVTEGAFTRNAAPLIITDDCLEMNVSNSKRSHTKQLSAALKWTGVNYQDRDVIAPGDWVFAWITNNREDLESVLDRVRKLEPVNEFNDGLKFVGRVHTIGADVNYVPGGQTATTYQLNAIGFDELDNQFFYDMALATAAGVSSDIRTFMAQIGLDFSQWADQTAAQAGRIKDNADRLIVSLVNMILGKGISANVNRPTERATAAAPTIKSQGDTVDTSQLKVSPQANKEAPAAYLVPRAVGQLLGRDPALASKEGGIFGYADILETLIGVQTYQADDVADEFSMYPELDTGRSTLSRRYTREPLKGTFLPVNPSFVNRPLFQILQQFLNPAINEMYTAMRVSHDGRVVPTLVVRQIPFSTESAKERRDFRLTKFMSCPRWVLSKTQMIRVRTASSNATRCNMVHVYGEASAYASNKSLTNQLVRNPPIFDETDIQRSGMRARMQTVNCAITDQLKAPRAWMEAIADWSFGSQYTLSGSLECYGIQSPVAEGDNVEFHGVVYHVESITHSCRIMETGRSSRTTIEVSNGMPADQTDATDDVPRYPGFRNQLNSKPAARAEDDADFGDESLEESETVAGGDDFEGAPRPGIGFETTHGRWREEK